MTEYNDTNTNLVKDMYNDSVTTPRTLFQNLGMQDPSLQSQDNMSSSANNQGSNLHMLGNTQQPRVTAQSLLDKADGGPGFDSRHFAQYQALANQTNRNTDDMTKANMANDIALERNDIQWDSNNITKQIAQNKIGSDGITSSIWDDLDSKYRLGLGSNLNYNNQINSKKPDDTTA